MYSISNHLILTFVSVAWWIQQTDEQMDKKYMIKFKIWEDDQHADNIESCPKMKMGSIMSQLAHSMWSQQGGVVSPPNMHHQPTEGAKS